MKNQDHDHRLRYLRKSYDWMMYRKSEARDRITRDISRLVDEAVEPELLTVCRLIHEARSDGISATEIRRAVRKYTNNSAYAELRDAWVSRFDSLDAFLASEAGRENLKPDSLDPFASARPAPENPVFDSTPQEAPEDAEDAIEGPETGTVEWLRQKGYWLRTWSEVEADDREAGRQGEHMVASPLRYDPMPNPGDVDVWHLQISAEAVRRGDSFPDGVALRRSGQVSGIPQKAIESEVKAGAQEVPVDDHSVVNLVFALKANDPGPETPMMGRIDVGLELPAAPGEPGRDFSHEEIRQANISAWLARGNSHALAGLVVQLAEVVFGERARLENSIVDEEVIW